MTNYQEKIYDAKTNKTTFVNYSSEQIKENDDLTSALALKFQINEQKEQQRKSAIAKLAALGLTEEEIAAL